MPNPKDYLANVQFLLEALTYLPIQKIVTEQYPQGLGSTDKTLNPCLYNVPTYAKTQFNACIPEVLEHITDSIQHVVIIGMETSICVEQTAHQLLADYPKLQLNLIRDALIARNPIEHEWALNQLQADGATLLSSESFLYRLLADSTHPNFKAISRLVKKRHHQ